MSISWISVIVFSGFWSVLFISCWRYKRSAGSVLTSEPGFPSQLCGLGGLLRGPSLFAVTPGCSHRWMGWCLQRYVLHELESWLFFLFSNVDHFSSLYAICYNMLLLQFWLFGLEHAESQLPDPWLQGCGSNLHPCLGRQSLNHWTTKEVPRRSSAPVSLYSVAQSGRMVCLNSFPSSQ